MICDFRALRRGTDLDRNERMSLNGAKHSPKWRPVHRWRSISSEHLRLPHISEPRVRSPFRLSGFPLFSPSLHSSSSLFVSEIRKEISSLRSNPAKAVGSLGAIVGALEGGGADGNGSSKSTENHLLFCRGIFFRRCLRIRSCSTPSVPPCLRRCSLSVAEATYAMSTSPRP